MTSLVIGLVLALVLLAAIVGFGIVLYNRLVDLRNRAEQTWADVDVTLRRRADLIPNLVETVRGYATHEQETFQAVTEARARIDTTANAQERAESEGFLTQALGRLFAVAEQYPALQADQNFRELQAELANTEQLIADARQRYNAQVRAYLTAMQVVPTNIVAALFNFEPRDYFEIDDPDAREPVEVRF